MAVDLNKVAAAEKLLYDMDMEEKNWRAARATVGDLLATVREAHKELSELGATKTRLQSEIKSLEKSLADGHAAIAKEHEAKMAELHAAQHEAEQAVVRARDHIGVARRTTQQADQAAATAQQRQYEAENKLAETQAKIKEAQELLEKLTKVNV